MQPVKFIWRIRKSLYEVYLTQLNFVLFIIESFDEGKIVDWKKKILKENLITSKRI